MTFPRNLCAPTTRGTLVRNVVRPGRVTAVLVAGVPSSRAIYKYIYIIYIHDRKQWWWCALSKRAAHKHTRARAHSHAQTHPPRYTAHRAKRLHAQHSGGAAVAPGRLEQEQKKKQYGRKQQFSHLVNTVCGSAKKKKKTRFLIFIYIWCISSLFSHSLFCFFRVLNLYFFSIFFLCHVNHRRTYKFDVLSLTEQWTKEWTKRKKSDDKSSDSSVLIAPGNLYRCFFICRIFLSHLIVSDLLGLEPIGRFFDATKWSSSASRRAHEWRHPLPPFPSVCIIV